VSRVTAPEEAANHKGLGGLSPVAEPEFSHIDSDF
jgi:hypothetical protein